MIKKWTQNDPEMDPKRSKNRPEMIQKWTQNDPKMAKWSILENLKNIVMTHQLISRFKIFSKISDFEIFIFSQNRILNFWCYLPKLNFGSLTEIFIEMIFGQELPKNGQNDQFSVEK